MVELLRGVDRGLFTLDESHTLTDADKVPGSGVLLALHTGPTLTYGDLPLPDDRHQRQHRHQHPDRPRGDWSP